VSINSLKRFILILMTLRLKVLHHADCLEHVTAANHQEAPERIGAILDALRRDSTCEGSAGHGSSGGSSSINSSNSSSNGGDECAEGVGATSAAAAAAAWVLSDVFPPAPLSAVERAHATSYVYSTHRCAERADAHTSAFYVRGSM